MGILDKLFGGKSQDPAAHMKGRMADLANISRLADQDRWSDAVAALDRFLGLPGDAASATMRLKALMKDPNQFRVDVQNAGRDAEGRDLARVRVGLGGGSVPQLMALRGRFLLSAIENRIKQVMRERSGATNDAELLRLRTVAVDHVNYSAELFILESEVLVPAARLCGVFGNYQGMQQLLAEVLRRDPGHAEAKQALADLEARGQR